MSAYFSVASSSVSRPWAGASMASAQRRNVPISLAARPSCSLITMPGSGKANSCTNSQLAAAGEGVDELVADALHIGDHLADPARGEDLVQEAAVAGVFGRVGLMQGRDVRPALLGEALVK